MNRTLTLAMLFAAAVPLFAAEPKPVANPTQPTAPVESPLVAAARRANRLGKKPAYVITNDNLVTKGGHFTTTDQQIPFVTPLYPPGGPAAVTPPAQNQQTAADANKAEAKKAEEERLKVMKQLQMQYEGETLEEGQDPAAIEQHQQQMQKQEKKQ
jgi:hypothetical protein